MGPKADLNSRFAVQTRVRAIVRWRNFELTNAKNCET
jgi:hypothetical protein